MVDEMGNQIGVLKRGQLKAVKNCRIKLIPGDKDKIKIVQEMFRLRAYANMSLREIADYLNSKGIPTVKDRKWKYGVVSGILRNETYIGNSVYNKRAHITSLNKSSFYKPKEEWIRVENTHEPLIDKKTWEIVQSKSDGTFTSKWKLEGKGRYHSDYLLTGVIKCADCGNIFNGSHTVTKNKAYYQYICSGYVKRGKEFCARSGVPRDELEASVQQGIEKRLQSKQWRIHIKEEIRKSVSTHKSEADITLSEIDRQLSELNTQIRNVWSAISKGVDVDTGTKFLEELKAKQDKILEERHELKKRLEANVDADDIYGTILSYIEDIPNTLTYGNHNTRKEVMRSLCPLIEVSQRNSFIKYYFRKIPTPIPAPKHLSQNIVVLSSMLQAYGPATQ